MDSVPPNGSRQHCDMGGLYKKKGQIRTASLHAEVSNRHANSIAFEASSEDSSNTMTFEFVASHRT